MRYWYTDPVGEVFEVKDSDLREAVKEYGGDALISFFGESELFYKEAQEYKELTDNKAQELVKKDGLDALKVIFLRVSGKYQSIFCSLIPVLGKSEQKLSRANSKGEDKMQIKTYVSDPELDKFGVESIRTYKEVKKDVEIYNVYQTEILRRLDEVDEELSNFIKVYINRTNRDYIDALRQIVELESKKLNNIKKIEELVK